MGAKFRSAMHDAVADGRWRGVEMFPDRLGESGKGIALRFDGYCRARPARFRRRNEYATCHCLRPMPSALPVSSGSSSLAPRPVNTKFQR